MHFYIRIVNVQYPVFTPIKGLLQAHRTVFLHSHYTVNLYDNSIIKIYFIQSVFYYLYFKDYKLN